MELDIQQNFNRIYNAILNQGIKRTAFAKGMGFSSTAQLAATLEGEALISTKAVIQLIQNFNINPTFLFTGQGGMLLAEKAEIDELNEKVAFIEKQKNELVETVLKMQQMIETLERRNGDLIDMTALALKNYKEEETKKKTTDTESSLSTK
jgi:transcriptional regulator with XRE-family HTH domain